jgi:hypothetical protein
LYLANSRLLSFSNPSTYDSHHIRYITADPARKSCTAGTFRTLDNVCKDCPVGTWSKDAASICCLDGQYEGSNAFCENCPPGKYLTWSKCRSSEKNDCRPCGKGKVRENKSKSRYSQCIIDYGRTILAFNCHLTSSILSPSIYLPLLSSPLVFLSFFP